MIDPISQTMNAASSGMRAQATRLSIASENLSNVDTNGYKRKLVTFQQVYDRNSGIDRVEVGQPALDQTEGRLNYDPSHPLANAEGYVELSNVDMMIEIADAREAGRSYDANLTTFRQAGEMYRGLLSLLSR